MNSTKAATILAVCAFLIGGSIASAQTAQTPLNLTSGFNLDAIAGPAEYRLCLTDGTADMVDLFGGRPEGMGDYVLAQKVYMIANGYGPDFVYSIETTQNHPIYATGSMGLPADGVLTGADRPYHVASLVGNDTMGGNWTETADPSDFSLKPNVLAIGALHNKADWQVADITVELPAGQKGAYQDVNFVLSAFNGAHLARNMRIVALYGDGTDEAELFAFTTESGGEGPIMTQPAPAGFTEVLTMTHRYTSFSGTTGTLTEGNAYLFEFDAPLALDDTKTLWGFRFEDVNPSLNWAARGLNIFAATATATAGANTAPVAVAGADQTLVDNDEDGFEDVQLDGSASADAEGPIVSHVWTEGGSTIAVGAAPIVKMAVATHTVTLTVTDGAGATDADSIVIAVDPPAAGAPEADAGPDQTIVDLDDSGDEAVTLDGSASYDPDGTIVSYDWSENGQTIATGETAVVTLGVGVHDITLTVTDNEGRTRPDTLTVDIRAYVAPMSYYVDAATGSDTNDGSQGAPFASIAKAVGLAKYGDTVIVADGIYYEKLNFTTSGFASSPITLTAADGAMPVISGAAPITGWTQASSADTGGNANAANIYYVDVAWKPAYVFQDNAPLTNARTPGWYMPTADVDANTLVDTVNITQPDGYWTGADLFIWFTSGTIHQKATITNHVGSTLTFPGNPYGQPDPSDHYWLANKVELIDAPGEWACEDNGNGTYRLFVWTDDSADPTGHLIEATTDSSTAIIDWHDESYLIIDGFEIRHGLGHGVGNFAAGSNHVTVRNCMIHHNGGTGIYGRYNDYGHYYRNYVGFCEGNGVTTSDSHHVLIEENEIHHNMHDGLVMNGDNVTVRRNFIHGHWWWGHADNCQTFNGVNDLLFDGNLLFNGGQSIMMEGTDGVTYDNNAIVTSHAYMVIAGHSTTFDVNLYGNTLMFPGLGAINSSGDDFDLRDNIFFAGRENAAFGVTEEHTAFASDHNLFFTADGLPEIAATATWAGYDLTLAAFQSATGLDTNSAYGNPAFANAPASSHRIDEHRVELFTPTRVYMEGFAMAGLEVGDRIELDWDGVVRVITAVGTDYIEFDIPKPSIVDLKAGVVLNWKTSTDFTLDLTPTAASPAVGLASDGGTAGTDIDVPGFRAGDFDGDGQMDIPRWGAAAEPARKPGDANLDGTVDLNDFVILKTNFGSGTTWGEGDFDEDGDVDLNDFVILKTNFGT